METTKKSIKGETYVVSLPLYITTGIRKKTKYSINLNAYKLWYYAQCATIKRIYSEQVGKTIEHLPKFRKIKLSYKVHFGRATKYDLDNIIAVTSKFFQDTLVEHGKIDDDNIDFIPETHNYAGDIDRENPRVDVTIEELE